MCAGQVTAVTSTIREYVLGDHTGDVVALQRLPHEMGGDAGGETGAGQVARPSIFAVGQYVPVPWRTLVTPCFLRTRRHPPTHPPASRPRLPTWGGWVGDKGPRHTVALFPMCHARAGCAVRAGGVAGTCT